MQVSLGLDWMTRLVHSVKPLWIEAGNIETALLAHKLKPITIDRPIFIGGLARSGSTLLLEYIAAHADVATHQYRDFPFIFTPYFSRRLTSIFAATAQKRERAHGDGMMVSPASAEAMEEIMWRAFKIHDEKFADFYRMHIRKLLLVTNAARYAAKNNNLTLRMDKLLTLFPDARIIIPIREPVAHIASLMRQHERFCAEANHPRALRHLRAQGHDEFGPLRHWQQDDEIAGWCVEWNRVYGAVLPYLDRENVMVVPYEILSAAQFETITRHAGLAIDPELIDRFAHGTIARQYESRISAGDQARIRMLTAEINLNFTNSVVG